MGGDGDEGKSKQKEYQTSLLLLGSIVMVRSLCQLSFKLGLRLRRKVTKKIRKQQIVLPLDTVDWIFLTYRVYNDYSSLRRKLITVSHALRTHPGLKISSKEKTQRKQLRFTSAATCPGWC